MSRKTKQQKESLPRQLDDQPGLLKGRHDPGQGLPDEDKLAWLAAVQQFFGKEWLSNPANATNPMHQLWHRDDWVASSELFTFGRALQQAAHPSAQPWLRDHAQRMRQHDPNGARGSAFEILCAAMLATDGQRVEFPAPSEPGYDLRLLLPNGRRLRVSCKALASSQYGADVRAASRRAFVRLRGGLFPGAAVHLTMEAARGKSERPDVERLLNFVRGQQVLARGAVSRMTAGPWNIAAFPLQMLHDAEFSSEKVSLGLSVFVPLHGDEQKRFDDKLDDACTNLTRHFPNPTEEEGAIIAMSVPEEISLAQASAYAVESRLSQHTNICALLLVRTQVCSNGNDIALGHEFQVIMNPKAQRPLPHYAPGSLTLSMLFGYVLGATPFDAPSLPPYFAPAPTATHAFERQHHHYIRHYEGNNIPAEKPPHMLGLSCDWTFLGKQRVDIRFTSCVPERELVVL
jgi:hypothetical protein